MLVTLPSVTKHVPAKPFPPQPGIPVQSVVALAPSRYPVPALAMLTDAIPSALQIAANPVPEQGGVQSTCAAPEV